MSQYKNASPSKKLRSLKRLMSFIKSKSSNLPDQKQFEVVSQKSISFIPPQPNLDVTKMPSIDLPSIRPKLSCVGLQPISIPPRLIYHPNIINACNAWFSKHPRDLTSEEIQKFNNYRNRKIQIGEPIESEIIYMPSGGIRTCQNCGELT